MTDRRGFIHAGGLAALYALLAEPGVAEALAAAAENARGGQPPRFENLTPEQAADLEAVAAQIIPTDDLPGAREARVIVFIDRSLGGWAAGQREPLIEGLEDLNRRAAGGGPGRPRFSQLDSTRQIALLRSVEQTAFFGQMQFLTKTGMFASPEWGGNFENAGYRVESFEPRFIWQPPFGAYDVEANGGR